MLDIPRLREVVTKLTKLLAGQNIKVTQIGMSAYVRQDAKGIPVHVNIPFIPDNATEQFVFAIQGFIDHEIAHIFFTDFALKIRELKAAAKSGQDLSVRHDMWNIVEDTMIERLMGRKFPGAIFNLDRLHEFFIQKMTQPAFDDVAGDNEKRFSVALVPLMRAMSGQRVFAEWMKTSGADQEPLIKLLVSRLPKDFETRLRKISTTREALDLATIIYDIVRPPPIVMPAPPTPPEKGEQEEARKNREDFQDYVTETESDDKQSSDEAGDKGESDAQSDGEKGADDKGDEKTKDDPENEPKSEPKDKPEGDEESKSDGSDADAGEDAAGEPGEQPPGDADADADEGDADGDQAASDADDAGGDEQADGEDQGAGDGSPDGSDGAGVDDDAADAEGDTGSGDAEGSGSEPGEANDEPGDGGDGSAGGGEKDTDAGKSKPKKPRKPKKSKPEPAVDAADAADAADDDAGDGAGGDDPAGADDAAGSEDRVDDEGAGSSSDDGDQAGDRDDAADGSDGAGRADGDDDDADAEAADEGQDADSGAETPADGEGEDEAADAGEEGSDGAQDGPEGSDQDVDGDLDGEGDGEESEGDPSTEVKPVEEDGEGQLERHDSTGTDGPRENDDEQEGGPGVGGGDPFAQGKVKIDARSFSEALSDAISDLAKSIAQGSDYLPYTKDNDIIERLEVPSNFDDTIMVEMEDRTRRLAGVMQKDIERLMASRSQVLQVPGFRSGKLHAAGLHRLKAGDDRVFRRKKEHKSKDTEVTLLIDNSGSMASVGKIDCAAMSGYALSSVLERCGIKHEVLGFTTGYPGMRADGTIDNKELRRVCNEVERDQQKLGREFSRFEALVMPIYKDFDERLTPVVKRRFASMTSTAINSRMSNLRMMSNLDGESLEVAAFRLRKRTASRKVIIVLSDGQPAGGQCSPHVLYGHLRKVIADTEKHGIEIIGIGIQSKAVKEFYKKAVVINDVEDLPAAVMGELKKILLTP